MRFYCIWIYKSQSKIITAKLQVSLTIASRGFVQIIVIHLIEYILILLQGSHTWKHYPYIDNCSSLTNTTDHVTRFTHMKALPHIDNCSSFTNTTDPVTRFTHMKALPHIDNCSSLTNTTDHVTRFTHMKALPHIDNCSSLTNTTGQDNKPYCYL